MPERTERIRAKGVKARGSHRAGPALVLSAAVAVWATPAVGRGQDAGSFLIVGARVVDGTGAEPRAANVRVTGGRISAVGHLSPRKGEAIIDGSGRVIAPGFIDVHNHSTRGVESDPLAESQVSQGIIRISPTTPVYLPFGVRIRSCAPGFRPVVCITDPKKN